MIISSIQASATIVAYSGSLDSEKVADLELVLVAGFFAPQGKGDLGLRIISELDISSELGFPGLEVNILFFTKIRYNSNNIDCLKLHYFLDLSNFAEVECLVTDAAVINFFADH